MASFDNKKSFLEEHHALVLKCKVKAIDGTTQIRRVKLDRLAALDGKTVSYDKLCRMAVEFSFGEPAGVNYKDYVVFLSYYDLDNDMIAIGSTEELMDAVEQFSAQVPPVLRITTSVAAGSASSAPAASPAPAATTAAATMSSEGTTADRGTSTRGDAPVLIPVQMLLESFVGILNTAVHHVEKAAPAVIAAANAAAVNASASHTFHTAGTTSTETGNMEDAANTDAKPEETEKEKEVDSKPAAKPEMESETAPAGQEDPRPFIHGRHTCDSCLSTPIIGKRFHSINVPDYDLCQNCFTNYKGNEVQFEPVELDRDRPFQERWHRRHQKSEMMRARAGRFGRGGPRGRRLGGGPGRGPRVVGGRRSFRMVPPSPTRSETPVEPPFSAPFVPQSSGHCAHIVAHCAPHMHGSVGPPAPAGGSSASDFDTALKEAIRRSLSDIAPKEAEIANEKKEEAATAAAATKAPEKMEGEKEPTNGVAVKTVQEDEKEEHAIPMPVAKEDTKSETPRSVEIPNLENVAIGEAVKDDLTGMDVAKWITTELEKDIKKVMEISMDGASVDSEKLVADDSGLIASSVKVPSIIQASPVASRTSSKSSNKDESFASDAIGNGDVAEAIGATLDMVVGQISDMLDEQEPQTPDMASGEIIVEPQPKYEADAEDGDEKQENETDGDWSVVKSVASNASDGTTEEEQIARAATMLGSALFNSDMKTSCENVSASMSASGASSFSIPSSASPGQLNRWATQLEKLRGIGFENESKCVEVLERLEAANIGVDSDEEIELNAVVNTLLEEQEK